MILRSITETLRRPWTLKGQLLHPATRATGLKLALAREKLNPGLAIAILAGNFPAESKRLAVEKIGGRDLSFVLHDFGDMAPYPTFAYHSLLPKFFRLLAGQPDEVIRQTHEFWTARHEKPVRVDSYQKGKALFTFEEEKDLLLNCGARLVVRTYRFPLGPLPFSKKYIMYDRDHHIVGCRIDQVEFAFALRQG